MRYMFIVLFVFLLSSCSEAKVSFCKVDIEQLSWTCTKVYRGTDNPNEVISTDDLVSCRKLGGFPWVCESTDGGLTLRSPEKYISSNYFVIIDEK